MRSVTLLVLAGAVGSVGCAQTAGEHEGAHSVRTSTSGGRSGSGGAPGSGGVFFGIGTGGQAVGASGACGFTVPASDDAGLRGVDAGDGGVDLALGAGDLTLLVVFDKSGSMASPWDERSKWQAASDAMLAGMTPYLSNLTIGAILFPLGEECTVPSMTDARQIEFVPGARFVERWAALACVNQPNGGTPLEAGLRAADAAIAQARDLALLDDRFRVIVVTDGEPNCDSDEAALTALPAAWTELGVETYVLGLPGSLGATDLLDAMARAGGTEKHQSPGDPGEFREQVAHIAR